MFCCSSTKLVDSFHDVPLTHVAGENVKNLTKQVKESKEQAASLPPAYRVRPIVRVVLVAVGVVGVAAYFLALSGQLSTFPQSFVTTFQNINYTHLAVGSAIFTVLTGGAAVVIYRALHTVDPLTKKTIGKLWGSDHWEPAFFTFTTYSTQPVSYYRANCCYYCRPPLDLNSEPFETPPQTGYLDLSTLDKNESGTAFYYGQKACVEHYSVSTVIALTAPLHAIGAIVYNTIRVAIIPFYIALRIAMGKTYEDQRKFQWKDIPREMGWSIFRIVKAPFYATAMIFAALYSYIDPMNGRKLGSFIERDWNEGVTRAQGYWSVGGAQSLFEFEGGGGPEKLGRNGFYVAGCWQPFAVVHFQDGKIVSATSLTKAHKPSKGRVYNMKTYGTLLAENNEAYNSLAIR